MLSSLKQSNFDNIFHEKLTCGSINAALASGLDKYSVSRSLIANYYSEGIFNDNSRFAAFQTSREAVVFVESQVGCYTPFFTSYFWSDKYPDDWWSPEECFQQCIAILETYPEAIHHHDALFDVLKNLAQPTSLLS